jgi:hypothetical protein
MVFQMLMQMLLVLMLVDRLMKQGTLVTIIAVGLVVLGQAALKQHILLMVMITRFIPSYPAALSPYRQDQEMLITL